MTNQSVTFSFYQKLRQKKERRYNCGVTFYCDITSGEFFLPSALGCTSISYASALARIEQSSFEVLTDLPGDVSFLQRQGNKYYLTGLAYIIIFLPVSLCLKACPRCMYLS